MGSIEAAVSDYEFDVGQLHRSITTKSKECQTWFDRGLVWTYGFQHDEALTCFEKAIERDPDCAMAYWGIAYAIGPNYNMPWKFFKGDALPKMLSSATENLAMAKERATAPVEKALISALERRYGDGDRNILYSDAMKEVYQRFSDNNDVVTLYVDSLMNLDPWGLWDRWTGEPKPHALEAKRILELHMCEHPGMVHLYIHLMEMSPMPEVALGPALHLSTLVPDSGHLQHMISHITLQMGQWKQSIKSNDDAIRADNKYLNKVGDMRFYTLYRAHCYSFNVFCGIQSGQFQLAMDNAEGLIKSVPEALVKWLPDLVEPMTSMIPHVLVRFGKWEEALKLELMDEFYSFNNAIIHYAKGMAYANTGRPDEAEAERKLISVLPSRMLFENTCEDVLNVARAVLDGEIEYRRNATFGRLRDAVKLCDNLHYAEPWGWMHPPRHALGALLLQSGKVEEALEVYEADLGLGDLPRALWRPNNVWSLHGRAECLQRLHRDAKDANELLKTALAQVDVEVNSSCACRR